MDNSPAYAGFWRRVASVMIDSVLFTPLYAAIAYGIGVERRLEVTAASLLVTLVLYAFFFSSRWQATPGMRLLGFHVADMHNKAISARRAMVWVCASSLGLVACFSGIIYLQFQFDIMGVLDLMQSCQEENLTYDDCKQQIEDFINIPLESFMPLLQGALALAFFLLFIWMLSIVIPKEKTGLHNLFSGTRFIMGRPSGLY